MHLDPRIYAALVDGTLPRGEARALGEHLRGDCPVCERFLAERVAADALDGRADAALDRAFPAGTPARDDLAFARVQRRLRTGPRGRRRALTLGAVAASLIAIGAAGLLARQLRSTSGERAWDGTKGARSAAPAVHLRFVALRPGGDAVRGVSGDPFDRGATLSFEVETDRPADVALVRLAPDAAVEPLWRQRVAAGRTVLGAQGRTAAYPLTGVEGRQRFVLVASDRELDPRLVELAVKSLAARSGDAGAPGQGALSYDMVEVSVR